jgi:hypothetical protein
MFINQFGGKCCAFSLFFLSETFILDLPRQLRYHATANEVHSFISLLFRGLRTMLLARPITDSANLPNQILTTTIDLSYHMDCGYLCICNLLTIQYQCPISKFAFFSMMYCVLDIQHSYQVFRPRVHTKALFIHLFFSSSFFILLTSY